jgi:hypothetical protein
MRVAELDDISSAQCCRDGLEAALEVLIERPTITESEVRIGHLEPVPRTDMSAVDFRQLPVERGRTFGGVGTHAGMAADAEVQRDLRRATTLQQQLGNLHLPGRQHRYGTGSSRRERRVFVEGRRERCPQLFELSQAGAVERAGPALPIQTQLDHPGPRLEIQPDFLQSFGPTDGAEAELFVCRLHQVGREATIEIRGTNGEVPRPDRAPVTRRLNKNWVDGAGPGGGRPGWLTVLVTNCIHRCKKTILPSLGDPKDLFGLVRAASAPLRASKAG